MDDPTKNYYSTRVRELAARYEVSGDGGVSRHFPMAFPAGGRVLDVGAGTGRDMRLLLDRGYDARGVDVSSEMVRFALNSDPRLCGRLEEGGIPTDRTYYGGGFDGVLCSAVLMHVPDERMFDAAYSLRRQLRPGGRLLLSVPAEYPGITDGRAPDGRLFILRPANCYALLFERLGFACVETTEDADGLGREGIRWIVMIFTLREGEGARSIDRIESVLTRDKKTATYKLALLRALADIAASGYNAARWYADGSVGIPLDMIAEKWLWYYWPVFENDMFIPQINGESPGCPKPVRFRKSVEVLISLYRRSGGMARCYNDVCSRGTHDAPEIAGALKSIGDTIVRGPVRYAGGSLDDGTLFEYDGANRAVVVPGGIWKELSLMWHWIRDALVLRWGELSSRMSGGEIRASTVIDLLLRPPVGERDTAASRDIFIGDAGLVCVWSGKRLVSGRFDIDHVIPYSLWYNNDLWNLLPSDPAVNNRKRDRLPTRRLWDSRRDTIIDCWRKLSGAMPRRFLYELSVLTGKALRRDWELPLHAAVTEAIEITALQRGVERWDG